MVISATAFFGIWTWLNDSGQVTTIGQRATVIADLVWGLAGLTGSLGVFLSKPWTVWPLAVWAPKVVPIQAALRQNLLSLCRLMA